MSKSRKTWEEMGERERDALVAEKVMGQPVTCEEELDFVEDGSFLECPVCRATSTIQESMKNERIAHMRGDIPHYTTMMSDAWTVVERMLDKVVCTCEVGNRANESTYVIITFDRTLSQYKRRTSASTMPEAICIAALKVAEVI